MLIDSQIKEEIERIGQIYCEGVLPRRHRLFTLVGRKSRAELQRTFLGYEVKVGRRRFTCPDRITALYLRFFAEIGLAEVKVPYDPTLTAKLVPGLEGALEKIHEVIRQKRLDRQRRLRTIRRVYRRIRSRLTVPDPAGDPDPE